MQQWIRQVGKILACNTEVLEVFARGEHFHPLAFLAKQFPLNWIEKCKMTLYVWITATGWLPKQSTTVNKVGNIIIAAISDHRERIVAASRKSRNVVFEGNKFLIFPAMESHRRESSWSWGDLSKKDEVKTESSMHVEYPHFSVWQKTYRDGTLGFCVPM